MKIDYHKDFLKNFQKRIASNPQLDARFQQRLRLFLTDPQNPVLKNHKLVGKKSTYWSFSITGDIRVIYQQKDDHLLLFDIGSHNQVY